MTTARFRFTPSLLDGETLEQLFVARDGLLDSAVDAIRHAATTDHRAHRLFVGPRGAGKTHLISLVHHRMSALRREGLRVQASWLVEDPWDIGSYTELLEAILEAREDTAPLDGGDAEAQLLASIAVNGPIVVLAENFDRILTAIGSDGQRRLRALLENSRPLLLMTTATRLSDEVARQDEPFYGFFSVTHLEPFGVEDAAAMLIALAKHEQNEAQLKLLSRPEAARRLATIAHLAGGQPRVWALLGPALQTSGIEDLVTGLLARVDDLTPYYQEQLAHLSPQEARVVRRMAAHDCPLTVRGIAELAKLDQRSVGKTISDLRRRGWIKQYSSAITELADKRNSYYQLAEPLARLAFQVKESRGEPIQLVVEFIAAWHDIEQVHASNSSTVVYTQAAQSLTEISVVARALADSSGEVMQPQPITRLDGASAVGLLGELDDALDALGLGNPGLILALPASITDLVAHLLAESTVANIRLEVASLAVRWMIDWRHRIAGLLTDGPRHAQFGLQLLLAQEVQFGTPASIEAMLEPLLKEVDAQSPIAFGLQAYLATSLSSHDRRNEGLALMTRIVESEEQSLGPGHELTIAARLLRATMLDEHLMASAFATVYRDAHRFLGPDHSQTRHARQLAERYSTAT